MELRKIINYPIHQFLGAKLFEIFLLPIFLVAILLILAVPLIIIYLFLRLSETAFEQVGFDHWHASLAVFGSVIGSLVDLPLHSGPISSYPGWYVYLASASGMDFATVFHPFYLAVNLGGCLIPLAVSLDLIRRGRASTRKAFLGILVVAVTTYYFAMPIANEGIVLPFWLSPTLAAICGLALAKGYGKAPALAYISGSMGTLLGADIFNLITPGILPTLSPLRSHAIKPLVLSIGGAGVFDGIFLTGILAVLFAAGIVCIFHRSCDGVRMHNSRN
jgi:uncharacterized membrane protein